jgi:two-component system, NtrC family, sensor kinase
MRLGIRLQLLLALGSLLVLSFAPLFFAVASLGRATAAQVRASSAVALGRAVAGHVTARAAHGGLRDPATLLSAQLGPEGVAAIAVYDARGQMTARAGEARFADALPHAGTPTRARRAARWASSCAWTSRPPPPCRSCGSWRSTRAWSRSRCSCSRTSP